VRRLVFDCAAVTVRCSHCADIACMVLYSILVFLLMFAWVYVPA
jgi:hypothetical protein